MYLLFYKYFSISVEYLTQISTASEFDYKSFAMISHTFKVDNKHFLISFCQ